MKEYIDRLYEINNILQDLSVEKTNLINGIANNYLNYLEKNIICTSISLTQDSIIIVFDDDIMMIYFESKITITYDTNFRIYKDLSYSSEKELYNNIINMIDKENLFYKKNLLNKKINRIKTE